MSVPTKYFRMLSSSRGLPCDKKKKKKKKGLTHLVFISRYYYRISHNNHIDRVLAWTRRSSRKATWYESTKEGGSNSMTGSLGPI